MKKAAFILLIALSSSLKPQNFIWAKQSGSSANDFGFSIVTHTSGNVFVAGVESSDIFIAKLNPNGNFLWTKKAGSPNTDIAYAAAVDSAQNLYTAGYFSGSADFSPGAGPNILNAYGSDDAFIYKVDANGNYIWAKQLGGTGPDAAQGIAVDPAGNIYATGYFSGIADFDPGSGIYNLTAAGLFDIFVCKLDPAGNLVWAKQFGSSSDDRGNSITIDKFGSVYSTGYFSGTVDFDPGTGVQNLSASSNNIYISKLDASGNFMWAKQLAGSSLDAGNCIITDKSGNVYSTGNFAGTTDFDPGAGFYNLSTYGSSDIYISKLDVSGNFIWAKQLGSNTSDYGFDLALDDSGKVYATGYFRSQVDFDPGPTTYTINTLGNDDVYIVKLDASGNFIWMKQMGGTNYDDGMSIAVDKYGAIYTTGTFAGTADFDPGSASFQMTSSAGNYDIFISKLGPCTGPPAQPASINGMAFICEGSTKLYSTALIPEAVEYVWSVPAGWTNSSSSNSLTTICNNSGGTISVYAVNACGTGGSQSLSVSVTPLPSLQVNSSDSVLCAGQDATLTVSGASTYFWNPGGSGSSIIVSPAFNTTYTVSGTSTTGCENTTVFTQSVSSCIGFEEFALTTIHFDTYPNPANESITILSTESGTAELFNSCGQSISKTKIDKGKTVLLLEEQGAGVYFIRFQTGSLSFTKKVIKTAQ
jgi:hypothetical protein